tara:strand:+ start:90 stop:944 length:855 start_codon:yes stop_codon:yes gene_type:complete
MSEIKRAKDLLKEPLLHFILFGALIFVYYSLTNSAADSEDSYDIHFDKSDIHRMKSAYQLSWSSLPDSLTLSRLIDEEVKAEIFSREAKRLDLHHNDEIIKRRLVQKYEFLVSDVADGARASNEELQEFYKSNLDKYKSDPTYSFYHFYFKESPNQNAKQSYQMISLNEGNVESILDKMNHHDPLHVSTKQTTKSVNQIEISLGKEFSQELRNYHSQGWIENPIQSGFGYHMVYVTDFKESTIPTIEKVKNKVTKDWRESQGVNFKNELYKSLKQKYKVKVEVE